MPENLLRTTTADSNEDLKTLDEKLEELRPALTKTLCDLIRIPSENSPPRGGERACQTFVANTLRQMGVAPDVYELTQVPGLTSHPEYWPGRSYAERPNVNALLQGTGRGRSLLLSGHIDTVPADTPLPWQYSPFGCQIARGRLYGRGAWDMKAGVAMNLTVLKAIRELGLKLRGDLTFETVVDEEFGGVNGTLAARLRGYLADAAVVTEPTSLRICPAQRGGRTLHITLHGRGGILAAEETSGRVIEQLGYFLSRLPEFTARRARRVAIDPYYASCTEPFAVWVTNLATGRWGWTQPITVPEQCQVELYWQAMPQETREEVEGEFHAWWKEIVASRPDLFRNPPTVELPMRWIPGSSIPPDSPLVTAFADACRACGAARPIEGMDAPADMYIFQRTFGIPAILWGPAGGGAHQADEFVELDSLFEATRVLLHFVIRWCGSESARP